VTVWPAGDKTKVGVRRKRDDESGVELVSIKVKRGDSSVKVEWLSLGNRRALGDFDTSSTITKAERVDGLDKNGSVTVSFPLTPRVEMPAAQQATQLQSVNVNPEIVDDEARAPRTRYQSHAPSLHHHRCSRHHHRHPPLLPGPPRTTHVAGAIQD